jgi:CHRD domain
LVIIAGAVLSLLLATILSNFTYAQDRFRAKLDGQYEVPPLNSRAEGVATFKVKDNTIQSKINIIGITDVSGAHIHLGKRGENGDPIVDLLKTGEKNKTPEGVTIEGNFNASDFEGSMIGKTLSDLQSAMGTNGTYDNTHTSDHQDVEISANQG